MTPAHPLNVMPPFYKGLSQGDIALLSLCGMALLGAPGLLLAISTGYYILLVSSLVLGALGVFLLPKGAARKLSHFKTRHCHYYAAKRIDRWLHANRYLNETRRFAPKRTGEV